MIKNSELREEIEVNMLDLLKLRAVNENNMPWEDEAYASRAVLNYAKALECLEIIKEDK